jgi:hypothetical protein
VIILSQIPGVIQTFCILVPEGQMLVATFVFILYSRSQARHAGVLHAAEESQFTEAGSIVTELLLNVFSVVLKSVVKT